MSSDINLCREQEVTCLVRVDVSTSANGVLAVAFSQQEKGFAPYRLDNCTGLKLHLRYMPPVHAASRSTCTQFTYGSLIQSQRRLSSY